MGKMRPIRDAYKAEGKYGSSQKLTIPDQPLLICEELLDYARLRGEVGRYVEAEFVQRESVATRVAMMGFLTGSIGPTTNAKLILDAKWPGRVKYTWGMAHKTDKSGHTQAEFERVLKDIYAHGIRHVIIVDELVSGTQLRTNLQALSLWLARNSIHDLNISVASVEEADRNSKFPSLEDLCEKEIRSSKGILKVVDMRGFKALRLLEKDTAGLAFRALKWGDTPGDYQFERRVAELPLRIVCRNGALTFSMPSASTLDQTFGNLVLGILEPSSRIAANDLIAMIDRSSCTECKELLAKASSAWGIVH